MSDPKSDAEVEQEHPSQAEGDVGDDGLSGGGHDGDDFGSGDGDSDEKTV